MEALNIIDIATRSGVFQTFTRLLEGSQLERKLRSENKYTLFAPVDIAFADLPAETLNQLIRADNQGLLAHVLSFHAVPGKLMLRDLDSLANANTVHGEKLTINHWGELRVAGARIVHKDIEARNGVIHGIDRFLLPTQGKAAASA